MSTDNFLEIENEDFSDDDDDVRILSLDYDIESIPEKIEQKYSNQIIQNFIEKIYYFNSLRLVGEWSLFNMVFKDMDIDDCKSYFAYLKLNGFFEDVKLYNSFQTDKQRKNITFVLNIISKTQIQVSKILPQNDEIILNGDFNQNSIISDEEYMIGDEISESDDEPFENQNIQEKPTKIIKMPINKYNHYKDFKLVVDTALKYIDRKCKLKWISNKLNIPYTTLCDWKKQYANDKRFRPYKRKRRNKYFKKDEDEVLFQKVKEQMKNQRFNYLSFLKILNDEFLKSEFHKNNLLIVPKFNAQWISNWRKNHRISLRKYHFRRRRLNDPEESLNYREAVFTAILRYGSRYVFNMDETSWGLVPHDEKVWAVTGADEVIFDTNQNYPTKARFTAIATINANGDKLPLITVAKGKTIRCEAAFKKCLGSIVTHTENGWSTESLMIAYIKWLSDRSNGVPICLIWDQYRAHVTQKVEDYSHSLNVKIIKVPAGQTGTEQPLDRLIFGGMKKTADKIWNEKLMSGEKNLYTRQTACQIMLDCWKLVKETTVKRAWNHFYNKNDDEIQEINKDQDWIAEEEEEYEN